MAKRSLLDSQFELKIRLQMSQCCLILKVKIFESDSFTSSTNNLKGSNSLKGCPYRLIQKILCLKNLGKTI